MEPFGDDTPVYVISVAAQLSGLHPQTLRTYDRLGLVSPGRTAGRGRRYSMRDIVMLREIQRLSQEEGVSLAGIQRILELENHVAQLRVRLAELSAEVDAMRLAAVGRVFAAGPGGDIVAMRPGQRPARGEGSSQALVVWRPWAR